MHSSARTWASAHIGSFVLSGILAVGIGTIISGCGFNHGNGNGAGGFAGAATVNIAVAAGNGQTGAPGTALPVPLVAVVTDQSNNPLANVPVVWQITSGGGSVTATLAPTNAVGQSQTIMTLGPAPGNNTATASVGSASCTFTCVGGAAGAPSTMTVTGYPGRVIIGTANTCVVTVKDPTGAVATGYRGTVKITSTDPKATLPANYTFTAADAGQHAFTVTLNSFGSWGIIATDVNTPTLTGKETPIFAGGGPATHFIVTGMPSSYSSGALSDITLNAVDNSGITDTSYGGTVKFSSTDGAAGVVLPATYTFTIADGGVHKFPLAVKLQTPGSQSVTATDKANATITGKQTVTVTATLRVTSFTAASAKVSVKGTDALSWTFNGVPTAVTLNGTSAGLPKAEALTTPGTDTPATPFPGGTPPGPPTINPEAFFRLTTTNATFTSEVPEVTQASNAGGLSAVTNAVASFSDGSYLAATKFSGSISIVGSTTTFTSPGNSALIVRYDATGATVWGDQNLGSSTDTAPLGVATFQDGSSVVTGYFTGTASFGGTVLSSAGGKDIFIVRYNADGSVKWAKSAGGTGDDVGTGVATFVDGSLAVAGYYSGKATFSSSVSLTATGSTDIFVARYAADGTLIWAKSSSGTADLAYGIAGTPDGHVIVTGSTPGTGGATDAVTTSYNTAGTVAWSSTLHSSTAVVNAGNGAAAFQDGSVVVTGFYHGSATFSGTATTLTSAGGSDVFVVKYSPTGTITWAKSAGGTLDDTGASVSVFADGSVAVAGSFQGTGTFGTTSLTSNGGNDAFLCRYDGGTGAVIWGRNVGGSTDDFGLATATFNDGSALVAGSMTGTITVGPGVTLSALGLTDGFGARFSPVNYGMLVVTPQGFDVCSDSTSPVGASVSYYQYVYTQGSAGFPDGSFISTGYYQEYTGAYYHTGASTGPVFGGTATNETSYDYGNNMFVARYKPDGTLGWVASPKLSLYTSSGTGYAYTDGYGVASFPDGTCVVVADYYCYPTLSGGLIDFGGGFTISPTTYESGVCFVHYSAAGVCTGLKKYTGVSFYSGCNMRGFQDGSFVIGGDFTSSITFDSVTLTPVSYSFFVVKFDATTTASWGASGGVTGGAGYAYNNYSLYTGIYSQNLTVFPDGSCATCVTCYSYSGTTGISLSLTDGKGTSSTLSDSAAAAYSRDVFIIKYKSDGTMSWGKNTVQAPSSSTTVTAYAEGGGISGLSDGSVLVAGYLYDKVTFGSTTVGSATTYNMFIAKYSSDGSTVDWVDTASFTSGVYPCALAPYADGSFVITGTYSGTLTFKSGTAVSATSFVPFLARYNSDGTLAWGKTTSGSSTAYATDLTSFADNSSVLFGYNYGTLTLGDSGEPAQTTLPAPLYTNFFFGKYFNY